jgi:5'-nucleotidase
MLELMDRKPDLCICGINYGENLGLSLTCSGTVGAAFEANSHGVNAIAFSKAFDLDKQHNEQFDVLNWESDKKIVRRIVEKILIQGFPNEIGLYNVNLPFVVKDDTEIRLTRQSRMNYSEFDSVSKRNFNEPYRLTTHITKDFSHLDQNTDIYTVVLDKCVSVTPIRWDISLDDSLEF